MVQSMPDTSPTKWHRAHTTWFFETFILRRFVPAYVPVNQQYEVLFNSYYNSVGVQFPRGRRGLISRPGSAEVSRYREAVDSAMEALIMAPPLGIDDVALVELVTLGLQHEQQHQELLLTDIKHALYQNSSLHAYCEGATEESLETDFKRTATGTAEYLDVPGGLVEIGFTGEGFHFDNETPRHRVFIDSFRIATRPLTNGDVLRFIEAGGYKEPLLWLSEGWAFCVKNALKHPLYWVPTGSGSFDHFTLHGKRALIESEVACHLSYFEADAIARFFEARLPTEQEWEHAASRLAIETLPFDRESICPGNAGATAAGGTVPMLFSMIGGVWEWTQSPYTPYAGYQTPPGAVGEYNGKFMYNQMVLRGGSCATPEGHLRKSYRNFFPGSVQWQFSGARLVRGAL